MLTRRWQMGLASVALAVAAQGSVHAAGQPAEFDKGLELLRRGQYAQAVQVLSAELKASDRPIEQRARTFYFRAKAYAALKEDALARADLNIAVWLKKLPPAEATDAVRLKTQLESAAPTAAPGLGVTPVASQPIAPVKAAPPTTETAAQLRVPARVTTTAAPPAPPPIKDAGQQRAAPAWSQASVARAPVETKPVAYIRPSPAFEAAAAASQQPQRPAVQTSTIVTGALPAPKKEANIPVAPPAPSTLWQTNVASQPSTTPSYRQPSTPPTQMAAAGVLPNPPHPVAPLRPVPTAYPATPAPSASPVAAPSAMAAAPRTQPPQTAALSSLPDQPKEPMEPAPAASQDGSSLPLVGWMFEKQSSPYDSQIARADDFQRRYTEKIRAYNQGARPRDSGAGSSQQ